MTFLKIIADAGFEFGSDMRYLAESDKIDLMTTY